MPCIKNTIKRISAFSIIELLIIISIISGLVIVAAPSFYGIFKQQFLVYNTHQLIQELRGIQSNAFIKHSYYKVGFNATEKNTPYGNPIKQIGKKNHQLRLKTISI